MSTLGDVCAVACADLFRDPAGGRGRIMASPMGAMPKLGAQLARATFAPALMLTDGEARIIDPRGRAIGWMPYERVFDVVWGGRRHVVMGATQIDQTGATNISAIGAHERPKVQLLGVRGGPGNTVHHRTSYWIPNHGPKVLVDAVDIVSGLSAEHAADLHRVVTNLCVFDIVADGAQPALRVISVHPGVTPSEVVEATGFALTVPDDVAETRGPTADEARWLSTLDPDAAVRGAMA